MGTKTGLTAQEETRFLELGQRLAEELTPAECSEVEKSCQSIVRSLGGIQRGLRRCADLLEDRATV